MRNRVVALLTIVFLPALDAQVTFDPVSRSAGGIWLRDAGDSWCALSAPPLLHSVRSLRAGFAHFPSPWGLAPLTSSAATAAIPLAAGSLGVSVTRFGSGLFCETESGIAWGASAGALLYGAALRLRHLSIARYGSAWTPRVDLAAAVATGEWFLWGVRITDVNRGAVGRSGERLRQGIALAAALLPAGLPHFLVQGGDDEGGDFSVRAAVTYDARPVSIIVGTSGSFTRIHSGALCSAGRFDIGYGVVIHPVLGWSHSFWMAVGSDP